MIFPFSSHLLHDMRLIIIAVHNRAKTMRSGLDHRTGKALSECTGRQFYLIHAFLVIHNTGNLLRKINAGLTAKIKYSD